MQEGVRFIFFLTPLQIGCAPPLILLGCPGLYMCARDNQEAAGDLKEQLERAIKEERYEDASKIRDAIKAKGSGKGPSDGASDASNLRERLRQKEINRLRDIDTGGDNMATPF
jgi:hypothetical protein